MRTQMSDSKLKVNSTMAYAISDDRNVQTFRVIGDPNPVTFDRRKASAVCRDYAEAHGWKQRIVDAAAVPMGTPAAERRAALAKVAAWYEEGGDEWRMPAGAGGPGLDPDIVAAVAEAVGKSTDAIREMVKAQSAAKGIGAVKYLNGLATSERVKPILERIRAAKPAAFDAEADLAEMMKAE